MPKPMPDAAPVTITTCPSNLVIVSQLLAALVGPLSHARHALLVGLVGGLGILGLIAPVARLPFALTRHLALLSGEPASAGVYRCAAGLPRARLIVVDDIGLLPVSPDAAEGFYRLVDAACEKRSVACQHGLRGAQVVRAGSFLIAAFAMSAPPPSRRRHRSSIHRRRHPGGAHDEGNRLASLCSPIDRAHGTPGASLTGQPHGR